jgi:two-component system response regulator RegA
VGRVLIADDDAVARAVLDRRLKAEGIAALVLASAAEGRGVDPAPLACALLDLELGDGSGADVANALRTVRPELPVAFFTSGASAPELARAGAIGPVFTKPAELDRAIAWVRSHIPSA